MCIYECRYVSFCMYFVCLLVCIVRGWAFYGVVLCLFVHVYFCVCGGVSLCVCVFVCACVSMCVLV